MRVVKYFEIVDNAVSKIFIKFDDPEVGRKLIGANRLQGSGQEEWHTQKFEGVVSDKNILQESHKSYAEASQEYDRLLNTACLYFSDSSCSFL